MKRKVASKNQEEKDVDKKAKEAAAALSSDSSSSSSSSDEDSEDDIKMYGAEAAGGQEEDESDDDEDEEEERAAAAAAAAAATAKTQKGKSKDVGGGKKKEGKAASKGKEKCKKESNSSKVEVSFDFSDPEESFFFGIRALLQWLAPEGVNITSLAELIVQEKGLGTIIHCTAETDVFALATVLNIQAHYSENDGMKTLCDNLLKKRAPPQFGAAVEKVMASEETFILLHARFVNLPLPLVPLLHKSSQEDMAWAQSSDATFPRIKQLFTISPCTVGFSSPSSPSLPYAPNDAIYDRFEDELFVQGAEMNYCFPRSLAAVEEEGGGGKEEEEDDDSEEEEDKKKKKKKKKKQKVAAAAEGGGGGGSGTVPGAVVSLVEESVVKESLPQMEEMVGGGGV